MPKDVGDSGSVVITTNFEEDEVVGRLRVTSMSASRLTANECCVAGLLRADVVGTSPSPVSLAEHRVLFGVGQDLPYLLRTAAGHGDLGSPRQRLFA
jgi:hypothetical protein